VLNILYVDYHVLGSYEVWEVYFCLLIIMLEASREVGLKVNAQKTVYAYVSPPERSTKS